MVIDVEILSFKKKKRLINAFLQESNKRVLC